MRTIFKVNVPFEGSNFTITVDRIDDHYILTDPTNVLPKIAISKKGDGGLDCHIPPGNYKDYVWAAEEAILFYESAGIS